MTRSPRWFALLFAGLIACCSARPPEARAADRWADIATANRQSPAAGTAASLSWTGADGKPVSVAIEAPRMRGHGLVELLRPVTGDNGPAITAALAKLRAAGGGTLRLAAGSYPLSGTPGVVLDGLSDVLIDAPGAQFVFAGWGDGLLIRNSRRLAIRGLSLGYARSAIIRATVQGGALILGDATPVPPPDALVHQITPVGPSDGTRDRRALFGKAGQPITRGPNGALTIGGKPLDFPDGSMVEAKLSFYAGAAIDIFDHGDAPLSHDITLDGITIRNSAGAGIAVNLMGRGLAMLRSQIGTQGPGGAATIAFDAFHVASMTGDVLVQGNHFTGSADDAMNLRSTIFDVAPGGDGGTALSTKGGGIYPGARIALFDAELALIGSTTIKTRTPRNAQGKIMVTFADALPTGAARYARNLDLLGSRYAVVDNEVSGCQCHGLLAQAPNGLIRGNTFSHLTANAIRLATSAWWHEGSGVKNVVVEHNIVRDTGIDARRGIVWAAITVYAELGDQSGISQPPVATEPINNRIAILNNDISGVAQGCISIASSADVMLAGNTCAALNRKLDRSVLLIERNDMVNGARRLPAKNAYLARGDGIWIDPLSTARVTGAP